MNNKISPSFIPKQAIGGQTNKVNLRHSGWLANASYVVLGLTVVACIVIYLLHYSFYQEIYSPCVDAVKGGQKCGLVATLEKEQQEIKLDQLQKIRQMDTRLKIGGGLISEHRGLIRFFDFLADNTMSNVQFTNLKMDDSQIELDGIASSYEDVALQSQRFQQAKEMISSSQLSTIEPAEKRKVKFSFKINLNPALLLYSDGVAEETPEPEPEAEAVVEPENTEAEDTEKTTETDEVGEADDDATDGEIPADE